MLSVTPVSAGEQGVEYLLAESGCDEPQTQAESGDVEQAEAGPAGGGEGGSGAEYLLSGERHGEHAGVWVGSGLAELGVNAGDRVDADTMRAVFGRLVNPETGEQLGRAPRKFKSPSERLAAALAAEPDATPERRKELEWQVRTSQRKAVGYYDLTFSPAKSVSVYYAALRAAGRTADADKVWSAHRTAVATAIGYLEREAGYSRSGYHGRTKDGRSVGEYVSAGQWIVTRWDHTTSREGDPQLHSHAAVLNRVRCEDGAWRALDGKALYQERAAAGAIYERTLEEAMQRDLPVRFELRPDGKAREIVGIGQDVRDTFSGRRVQVREQVQAWAADYEAKHGRAPSRYELTVMAQKAALTTRRAKSGQTESAEEQNARWAEQAAAADGGELEDIVTAVMAAVETGEPVAAGELDRPAVIAAAVADVQATRASWTRSELQQALNRHLPSHLGLTESAFETLLDELVDEAVAPGNAAGVLLLTAPDAVTVPDALRRKSDGRSRWRPHRDERYATEAQIAAEERLARAAAAEGAPMVQAAELAQVEASLVEQGLGDDQRAAVLGILGSGRRGDVLIGPAGSGKSFTVAALAEQWREHVGGPVVGLATSQNAAQVLQEEGLTAANISRWLNAYEPDARTGEARATLPANALLVIDETGMSATDQLDRVRRIAERSGAKLLWTGDHEQLDAVGAGGALRMLARGQVHELGVEDGRRFRARWEQEASLGLRSGSHDALRQYDEHGRVREGDLAAMTDAAVEGYLTDRLHGRSSVLLVRDNKQAADLSGRIRAELIRLGEVEAVDGVELDDETAAGVGDLVQTRLNAPRIIDPESGRWVINRDVWRVVERHESGALTVELDQRGADRPARVTLPPDYVAKHVTLAYASTVHAAQGRTVDRAHALAELGLSRHDLYVMLSRGRDANLAYVVTQAEPDDERGNERLDTDRIAVLSEILDRDTAQHAAVDVMREELEHADSLTTLGTIWSAVMTEQSRDRYADVLLDVLGPEQSQALDDEPGTDRLWRAVRSAELAGHDPEQLLRQVATERELATAESVADVLRHRIHARVGELPQPQQASWTERTVTPPGIIGDYAHELAAAMDARQAKLGEHAATEPPAWAVERLGAVPDDPTERAEWIDRAGRVAAYREMYGVDEQPTALGPAPSREMPDARAAWEQAYDALGAPEEERDFAAAGDDELRGVLDGYAREQAWAPVHVAELYRETELTRERYERKAALTAAETGALVDDEERDRTARRAAQYERIAAQMAERAGKLAEVHEARQAWYEHTADARRAAELARAELRRRGVETVQTEEPEQVAEDSTATEQERAPAQVEQQTTPPQLGESADQTTPNTAQVEELPATPQVAPEPEAEPETPNADLEAEAADAAAHRDQVAEQLPEQKAPERRQLAARDAVSDAELDAAVEQARQAMAQLRQHAAEQQDKERREAARLQVERQEAQAEQERADAEQDAWQIER
ncbi:MAG TPA: MobF family relaxase [Nocardioidaceae bacterium]